MTDPANDDELVNDDELLFERGPIPPAAPATTSTTARVSVPPPLPPLAPPPQRASQPSLAPSASREDSRYPTREDSRYPTREDAREPNYADSRYPAREDPRYPTREDSRYPTRDDEREPNYADSRYPTREDPRSSMHVDSIRVDSRRPSQAASRHPSHIEELRPASRDDRNDRGVRDDPPLQPGDLIAGKYQVERIVGRVGVGIVMQVRHADLGQRFRLKYLPIELCEAPDAVSRFLRGARRAMRLQSEHTARTVDAGRLPSGAPYVVTESNAGSDMREVLRVRGLLTVTEAVDFVLQAAESLAEAHAQGIIHKNLNLSTLFVTWRPDGSHAVKVQDFGVAESLRADPLRSSDLHGEPVTMFDNNPLEALGCLSPEQIRNNREIDGGADVWALGCILHQLLSGFPVFAAMTVPGLLASIVADPATPITSVRSDVPAGLESVILRCLEKNRGSRFPSLADLASALRRFASADAQASADRITRTLSRAQHVPAGMDRQFALVHVGPAVASQAPSAAAATANPRSAVVPYPLLWAVTLIAGGLIGGTIAGVLVATRQTPEPVALEQRINALQLDRNEPPKALPAPGIEAASATAAQPALSQPPVAHPTLAQPPVATSAPVTPPAAAPAVRTNAAPVAVARAKPSQPSKEASPKATPASESAPTANLVKDLFESVR